MLQFIFYVEKKRAVRVEFDERRQNASSHFEHSNSSHAKTGQVVARKGPYADRSRGLPPRRGRAHALFCGGAGRRLSDGNARY